jgi:hypothetical protein
MRFLGLGIDFLPRNREILRLEMRFLGPEMRFLPLEMRFPSIEMRFPAQECCSQPEEGDLSTAAGIFPAPA